MISKATAAGGTSPYLVVTHIPIFADGPRLLLQNDWLADILLTRDWQAQPFGGRLVLIAPLRPAVPWAGALDPVDAVPGVEVVPGMNDLCRIRHFWLSERRRWSAVVARYLPGAAVLHTAINDLFRPMQQLAFAAANRAGVPTVLVGPDMDPHLVSRERLESGSAVARARLRMYLAAFDAVFRHQAGQADLALLKEGAVHERYAAAAANPRAFCHTMYRRADVVPEALVRERLEGLSSAARSGSSTAGGWSPGRAFTFRWRCCTGRGCKGSPPSST